MSPIERRAKRWREIRREERGKYRSGSRPVACGKVCFASKSLAKSAVRREIGHGTMWGKELMTHYWCGKCQSWHIGHSRPWEERGADAV